MEEKASRPTLSLSRKKPAAPKGDGGLVGAVKGEIVIKGSRLNRPSPKAGLSEQAAVAQPVNPVSESPKEQQSPQKPKRKRVKVASADRIVFLSVDEIRAICISRWPELFDVERGLMPLKVGIHKDIVAELQADMGLCASRKVISKFLGAHCKTQAYLEMLQTTTETARRGIYGETSELPEKARDYSPTTRARFYNLTEEMRAYSARKAKRLKERSERDRTLAHEGD